MVQGLGKLLPATCHLAMDDLCAVMHPREVGSLSSKYLLSYFLHLMQMPFGILADGSEFQLFMKKETNFFF